MGMMEGLCSEGGPGCLTEHVRKDKAEAETCRHALNVRPRWNHKRSSPCGLTRLSCDRPRIKGTRVAFWTWKENVKAVVVCLTRDVTM